MKKQSRKKRNLEYIRFKNKLRKFEPIYSVFKITNCLSHENRVVDEILGYHIKELSRKYKMNLGLVDLSIGLDSDDFLIGLRTVKATIQRLKHNEK